MECGASRFDLVKQTTLRFGGSDCGVVEKNMGQYSLV